MKHIKTEHKLISAAVICSVAVTALTACSIAGQTASSSASASAAITSSGETAKTTTGLFSEKDLEIGYDESNAVTITLNGTSADSSSSSVKTDGSVITIKKEGTYVISGTLDDGYIVIDAGDSDDIRLILKDCDITSSDYAPIYCLNADNVYITLEDGTVNKLANTGTFDSKDDNSVDGAVFSKTDITINGSGSLEISSSAHGIVGKDDVNITGGDITVESEKDGIQSEETVAIQNASVEITCGKDGIQAKDEDDLSKGCIYIESGEVSISSDDDGITAANIIQIDDGTVSISRCYEGIEAQNITVNGGDISITSSDDAVNAVAASSSSGDMMHTDGVSSVTVNGGNIYIRTGGDGIDSNGSFEMNGGMLTIMGPENGANGSLDYAGEGTITGGTVIVAGASGMAMNFSSASQGSILLNVGNCSKDTVITVKDESGNVILSAVADCTYQTVLISSPDLVKGNSYTVTAGDYSETVELTDNIYGSGTGFGQGGFGGGMPGGGFNGDFDGNFDGNFGEKPDGDFSGMPDGGQNGFQGGRPDGFPGGRSDNGTASETEV
ncbi:carbohydrate-binding domain-containing protein [Butyrivibrio sp. AE2032]|uniref:carbohydrate-binding domain-containing protein n=1 Tax=Butyrivibrio sp. AE2032 TaxID=1458463 RepID=UPI00068E327F|nr:carbohydrate-binding domain-containing protein [Butyrivibrio sp. AE2032]